MSRFPLLTVEYWDILMRTASIDVLAAVCETPGLNQMQIVDGTERNSKLRRLKDLAEAGLIDPREKSEGRKVVYYFPTDEGLRVYRLLVMIRDGGDARTDHGACAEVGAAVNPVGDGRC